MKPGDVYRCEFGPARGSEPDGNARPAVVVSPGKFNCMLNTVVVVPFTSGRIVKARYKAICAVVDRGKGGLDKDSTAQAHNIRVIDKAFLKDKTGTLPTDYLDDIYGAVAEFLDLWG